MNVWITALCVAVRMCRCITYFTAQQTEKKSDEYGYVMPLCQEHHTGSTGIHRKRDFDLAMKKQAQEHFEAHFGARNDFIKVFGKSYL